MSNVVQLELVKDELDLELSEFLEMICTQFKEIGCQKLVIVSLDKSGTYRTSYFKASPIEQLGMLTLAKQTICEKGFDDA